MEQKLTPAQKREVFIMREHGLITTMGYGPRHQVLLRLTAMGLVNQGGPGFSNVFSLSPIGKLYTFHSDINTTHPQNKAK